MYQLWSDKKLKKVFATATLATFAVTGMATPAFAAEVTGFFEDSSAGAVVAAGDSTHITKAQQVEFSDDSWIQKQADAEKAIAQEFESGAYTLVNPLVKVNPYDNNYLSALVLFETKVPTTVTAEVLIPEDKSGAQDEYCKFIFEFDELTTKHTVPVTTLFIGANKVELTATDEAGNVEKQIIDIQVDIDEEINKSNGKVPITERKADVIQFNKNMNPAEGLTFCVSAHDGMTAYDMNGNVRAVFNSDSADCTALRVLENGHMMYFGGKKLHGYYGSWATEADMMGKVYKRYMVNGLHHEWLTLDNGNLLFNAELPNSYTTEDYIVEVDAETGAIVRDWWLRDSFGLYEYTNDNGTPTQDWAHINAMTLVPGEDAVVLSCRNQSTLCKLNLGTNEIEWLISAPDANHDEEMTARHLTPVIIQDDGSTITVEAWWQAHPQNKTGAAIDWSNPKDPYFQLEDCPFQYAYHQHAVEVMPNGDYLLFDNASDLSKDLSKAIPSSEAVSRAVVYRVNEEADTVAQIWQWSRQDLYSGFMSDADYLADGHYIIHYASTNKGAITVEVIDDQVASEFVYNSSAYYRQNRIDVTELFAITGEQKLNVVQGVQLGELLMDRAVLPGADLETVEMNIGEDVYITYGGANKMDTAAYVDGDKVMVPVRYVANALGAEVAWDAASETATITKGDVKATFTAGAGQVVIKDNRLMVPMTAVAEALDVPMTYADGVVTIKR